MLASLFDTKLGRWARDERNTSFDREVNEIVEKEEKRFVAGGEAAMQIARDLWGLFSREGVPIGLKLGQNCRPSGRGGCFWKLESGIRNI